MTTLDVKTLLYEEKEIFVPELEELRDILQNDLKTNFDEVNVEVVDCPDLTKGPFYLAGAGLGGDSKIVEYGGAPFLLPNVDLSKLYDIVQLVRNIKNYNEKEFFTVGAGAGPYPQYDQNCEGIFNVRVNASGEITNETHTARIVADGKSVVDKVPTAETRTALLGNLYLSEGKPGKVLKVSCKKRTGSDNFITAMRLSLARHFTDKTVGLGGVFILKEGKAYQHVMDKFSTTPIYTLEELNSWLKFFDMPAPLIALGTFVTDEADLDLRLQHFHSFSKHNHGGHYHYDVTPDTVEYEGYFNVGASIVRIDKPEFTHKFGRD